MPKGIRKACANCIKARLACDEGRPCQRCVVHQCECIAVPRKPRVKKQKLDLEPPAAQVVDKPKDIPAIDSSVEILAPTWGPSEFAYGSFQLNQDPYEGFPSPVRALLNSSTPSPTRLSEFDSPPTLRATPPTTTGNSPPAVSSRTPSPPTSPPFSWTPQMQAAFIQQFAAPTSPSINASPQIQPTPTQPTPTQPAQPTQQSQQPATPQVDLAQYQQQLLSLLLDEKPSTLLQDWPSVQNGYVDGQLLNYANSFDQSAFKKAATSHMNALPQAKNSTPLYPAPIAVFDKNKFQLLDANEAMANLVGHTNVAALATDVMTMDDLIDPDAALVAKNAYNNFVTNPSPCFRVGEIKVRNRQSKTVEFHVDLTEQLLILTVKSVFDSSSKSLPDVQAHISHVGIKKDFSSSSHPQCNCKACEFLSPID